MKKKFYVLIEKAGRKENGYIAEYKVLENMPENISSEWKLEELEVTLLDDVKWFTVEDSDGDISCCNNIKVNLSMGDLEKIITLVKKIDGYNDRMIEDIGNQIADVEMVSLPVFARVVF